MRAGPPRSRVPPSARPLPLVAPARFARGPARYARTYGLPSGSHRRSKLATAQTGIEPTGSRPAPAYGHQRSLRAPNSHPRPLLPAAPCVGDTPGGASPVPASSARAGRTSLLGQMTQGDARVLPALILATLRTAQAKRAPCVSLGAVTLVVQGSACSLTGAPPPPNPRALPTVAATALRVPLRARLRPRRYRLRNAPSRCRV